jgi:hypothetical protein
MPFPWISLCYIRIVNPVAVLVSAVIVNLLRMTVCLCYIRLSDWQRIFILSNSTFSLKEVALH